MSARKSIAQEKFLIIYKIMKLQNDNYDSVVKKIQELMVNGVTD